MAQETKTQRYDDATDSTEPRALADLLDDLLDCTLALAAKYAGPKELERVRALAAELEDHPDLADEEEDEEEDDPVETTEETTTSTTTTVYTRKDGKPVGAL
jgi:hypothetical protein